MTLALVEEDIGSELALRIAGMMVVFLKRPNGREPVQRNACLTLPCHTSGIYYKVKGPRCTRWVVGKGKFT
ncbi:MAG: hypothetical protein WA899_03990 [Candidatus Sulfotelmatobacter sp.]